ncbi:hypothetical protein IQ22_01020 [Pseudomonas duriflava]|uniref:Uncharacterized protein n=1 Tax=Pseudomonas duriflava TaxID=459528 RepID=A0A562QIK5_9PSED|nr:hypothetical protein [Pseudomonas duriflava]TWI56569.1 hypothetical protein IQ22_01020 [Pseudomonas duriflava]
MISQTARNNLLCSAFFAGAAAILFAADHSSTSNATAAVPHIEIAAPVAKPLGSRLDASTQKVVPAQSTQERFPRQTRWVF